MSPNDLFQAIIHNIDYKEENKIISELFCLFFFSPINHACCTTQCQMASAGIVCSVDLKELCTGQAVCRYPYIKNFSMTAKIMWFYNVMALNSKI